MYWYIDRTMLFYIMIHYRWWTPIFKVVIFRQNLSSNVSPLQIMWRSLSLCQVMQIRQNLKHPLVQLNMFLSLVRLSGWFGVFLVNILNFFVSDSFFWVVIEECNAFCFHKQKSTWFLGGREYLMRAHFCLPSIVSDETEKKPPISVKFEIPYFTTSGLQVGFSSSSAEVMRFTLHSKMII